MHEESLQATIAIAVVMGLQWAKRSSLIPFLNNLSDRANMFVSMSAAALAGMGLTIGFDGTLVEGGKLVITIPSLLDWLTHSGQQMFDQELFYRVLKGGGAMAEPPKVMVVPATEAKV